MCRTYGQFLSRVAAGRNMSMQAARKVARGRIWTGQDALQHGLVDTLGGLADAVRIAKQEADLSLVSPMRWPLVCMLPSVALPCSCSQVCFCRSSSRICICIRCICSYLHVGFGHWHTFLGHDKQKIHATASCGW